MLKTNIDFLEKTKGQHDIEYILFSEKNISDINFPEKTTLIIKSLTDQFIYDYVKPSFLKEKEYDSIIMISDTVELTSEFSLEKLVKLQKQTKIDILSPSVCEHSKCLNSMYHSGFSNIIRQINFLEYFMYYMSVQTYEKYFNTFIDKSTSLREIGFCLYYQGFTLGVCDIFKIKILHETIDEPVGIFSKFKRVNEKELGYIIDIFNI